MLNASSMPVPVSPIVGPGLIGLPPRSPVMLIAPPQAWAIGSKAEPVLIGAAGTEAFDLRINDARIEGADDVVAEAEPFDGTGREILGEDIGLLGHVLDQRQPPFGFEVDGDRLLVGVVRHEVIGVRDALAAGFAALRVLDLDDFGAHPGERLGAARPGLELRRDREP